MRHRRRDDLFAAARALLAQLVQVPEIVAATHENLARPRHWRLQVGVLQRKGGIPPLAALECVDRLPRRRHRRLARRQEAGHIVGDALGCGQQGIEMHDLVVDDGANSHATGIFETHQSHYNVLCLSALEPDRTERLLAHLARRVSIRDAVTCAGEWRARCARV
jgi:hypothetical protein